MGGEHRLGRFGRLAPLSASSTMAASERGEEGSSIVTLDLPKAPLAELANVMDLYQSIFGITPDVSAAARGSKGNKRLRTDVNSTHSHPIHPRCLRAVL